MTEQTNAEPLPDGWSEKGADSLRMVHLGFVPASYVPARHLAGPAFVGLGLSLACLLTLDAPGWELVLVPVLLVAANAFEWRAHRDVLHKRVKGRARRLYEDHTALHHRLYWSRSMAIRDSRELLFVLIPASAMQSMFLLNAAIGLVLAFAVNGNVARLFFATMVLYLLSYEWLHLAYHLPKAHPIARLPLIRFLGRHHSVHHDPRIMRSLNLNVTVPLWDWIQGTIASKGVQARALEPESPD